MARKPRLEFPGAIYHIISRGNYRKPIFEGGGGPAFEKALFQACGKCGWLLHAYVIMNNHYHLAVETPQPNLVEGMRCSRELSAFVSMLITESAAMFSSRATRAS